MGTDEPGDQPQPSDTESETGAGSPQQSTRGGADSHRHRDLLFDCLADPAQNVDRLPFVLTLLESDDQERRFLAAMTACRIATATNDQAIVEYLIRRLSDRLTGAERSLELTTALDYLTASYTGDQAALLDAIEESLEDGMPVPTVGTFTRRYYLHQHEREGSATAIVEEDDDEFERVGQTERPSKEIDTDTETTHSPTVSRESSLTTGLPDPETIAKRSRFDQVNVKGAQYRGRYATVYETIASRRGTQRAVSLRILDQPPEAGDIHPFETSVGEVLGEWAAVGNHRHVLPVFDWGSSPRPWVATALTATTLMEREHSGFHAGLQTAISLTETVSSLHQHDVVHGGIDPSSVVFSSDSLTDGESPRVPLLDHVGLIRAYIDFVSFDTYLAPRFAAPEYYADEFGRLDHLTDIYQLGTTCYYLLTGRAPFDTPDGPVREVVLNDEPRPPSAVTDDIPDSVDDILSKAMATEKLRRYETAEQFLQDLRAIEDTP